MPIPKTPTEILASLGSRPCPSPIDKDLIKNPERALKWTLSIDSDWTPHWHCSCVPVEIEEKRFALGSIRAVYRLRDYTCLEQPYVAKFSTRIRSLTRDRYFAEVLLLTVSSKFAELYNSFNPPKKVIFVPTCVLDLCDRDATCCTVEPFIEDGFRKYSGRSRYIIDRNSPQAFSHFSFVHSNQELLIVDIQNISDFYSEPEIHTKSGKGFGEGNLGQHGINQFIKTHQCNPICNYLKLEPFPSTRRSLLRGKLPVVQLELQ